MMRFRLAAALIAAVLVIGCKMLPTFAPPKLGISNSTALTVTLIVNGQVAGVFPPGQGAGSLATALPPLPWTVEARSATGRLLTTMRVEPGVVFRTTMPDGTTQESGTLGRVDLSCGRLDIWAGMQPSGPAPGPGRPGDCHP